ncbi:MAG: hypothetical protein BCS36_13405 [Desulfovibrio sp. MES5]|uniref:hypothetical protein n=1 Tax=Desulfovibrio sp. MES5 TaxID=1899016 RepID=UPI000B9CCF08|nr:hypothetical protein [Desulfovibrio sp. MES5]OXS27800.1 MAG: hypothetical protein BCS36_13405 [Desulfovibrio sp. MES5]
MEAKLKDTAVTTDTQALIDAVVQRVLAQLAAAPHGDKLASAPTVEILAPADDKLAHEVASRLPGARVRFETANQTEEAAFYVLPELGCSDMADLAQGRASSIALRKVLELLLKGKEVRVLGFAYRAYAETAPYALMQMYEAYEAALAGFGLTELAPPPAKAASLRQSLVTADHVAEAARTGAQTLRVPRKAVVTPLAQEAADSHHMTILKNL